MNNKSQLEVANKLGIKQSTFSSWCTGQKLPRMDKIEILAEYFGIMKSDLIEEKPVVSKDDELLEKIRKNDKIKYIASRMIDLTHEELEHLEQIIDAVLRK